MADDDLVGAKPDPAPKSEKTDPPYLKVTLAVLAVVAGSIPVISKLTKSSEATTITFSGVVREHQGGPVEGAQVLVLAAGSAADHESTDSSGSFSSAPLASTITSTTVTIDAKGYVAQTRNIDPHQKNQVFILEKATQQSEPHVVISNSGSGRVANGNGNQIGR